MEIVVDAHPKAFGDLLLLDHDARSERNETADEVYVGHSVSVAVLVSEADEGAELGFDAGLFTHFTDYGVRKMLAVMEMPSRELEGACADASAPLPHDEDVVLPVDDDAARPDVVGRIARDERAVLERLDHHHVSVGRMMVDEPPGRSRRNEFRTLQRRFQPNQIASVRRPPLEGEIEARRKAARVGRQSPRVDDHAAKRIGRCNEGFHGRQYSEGSALGKAEERRADIGSFVYN